MFRVITTVAVGVSVLLVAHGAALAQAGGVRSAIEKGNKEFATLFAHGNGQKVAALYTATAEVFPPNSDVVRGREAIGKFWQGAMDAGVKGVTVTTLEVQAHGDSAHEVGKYALLGEGGKEIDSGKYIVIWKREGGQWKLHRDIWNTNQPMAR